MSLGLRTTATDFIFLGMVEVRSLPHPVSQLVEGGEEREGSREALPIFLRPGPASGSESMGKNVTWPCPPVRRAGKCHLNWWPPLQLWSYCSLTNGRRATDFVSHEPFLLCMSSVTMAITRWGMEAALGTLQGRAEKVGAWLTQGLLFLDFLPVLSSSSSTHKIPTILSPG